MPQLPDLKAKLKVDLSELDTAAVKAAVLGQVLQRELGGSRGASIDNSVKQIGNSVEDAGRKMDNAGTAFIKWGDAGQVASLRINSSTARTKGDFDELERRTRTLGNSLETEFRKGATAVIKLSDDGGASLQRLTANLVDTQQGLVRTGGSAQAAGNGLLNISSTIAPLTVAVIGLGLALAPVLAIVIGFTAGLTAAVSVMGLAAAGIGALAVGVVLLANATGQIAAPMATLQSHLKGMADVLGQQAAPMAAQLLGWLDKLIPSVQTLGQSLLTWFGDRLPGILKGASVISKDLTDRLNDLGVVLGRFLDQAGARSPQLTALFDLMLRVGIGAVDGLLQNLLRLSDWFLERLPRFEPVISQIFGGLGSTVQAIGTAFGKFVDWVIANWPAIVFTLDQTWKHFVEGYNLIKPLLDNFHKDMVELQPLFTFIEQHSSTLVPLLQALGLAFGFVVAAIGAVIVVGVIIVAALVGIGVVITSLVNQIRSEMPAAGAQFSALGTAVQQMGRDMSGVFQAVGAAFQALGTSIHNIGIGTGQDFDTLGRAANQMQRDMGTFFGAIGQAFHQLGINIGVEVRAAGAQFDALGRAARQMQTDMGAIFSAIGSAANSMASTVGRAFSGLGTNVHDGLHSVSQVFDAFGRAVNGALGGFGVHINPTGYAAGGVVPGYAPGQDIVPALLSPGEGVLTPQTVRGLGGAGAIDALNRMGGAIHGLGAATANDVAGLSSLIGSIGGQCVVAVEKWTGHYFPVAMASQMTRWINSATAAIGSIFVSTIPPFGHTGIVIGPNKVIDSNWGLDERIRVHNLSDIPSIAGYITGFGGIAGGLSGLAGLGISLGSLLKPLIEPLAGAAHAAANLIPQAWARPFANSIIDKVVANIEGRAAGGPVVPGHLYTVGERGPELFSPDVPGQITPNGGGSSMATVERLLAQAVGLLGEINGTPPLSASTASRRYAT